MKKLVRGMKTFAVAPRLCALPLRDDAAEPAVAMRDCFVQQATMPQRARRPETVAQ